AFGEITTGARGDIHQATHIAHKMVCEWGMSEKVGMVEYSDETDHVFIGREIGRAKEHSEETARLIDNEVKRIIQEQYDRAKHVLEANRDKLELIAKALLEYETLTGKQIKDLLETGKFDPPPKVGGPVHPMPPDGNEGVLGAPKRGEDPRPPTGLAPAPTPV
ncbi:MAG: cell division protein FtsH, partial [Verrucomicrobiae bacterium]|nr:cell division protein FtsH [Verrucomicrobiae bacterium]